MKERKKERKNIILNKRMKETQLKYIKRSRMKERKKERKKERRKKERKKEYQNKEKE